jgi:hypothetical protein
MRPWRAISVRDRVPRVVAVLGWAIAMIALFAVWQVEVAARHQPAVAEAMFSHPYFFKGTWRYLTGQQAALNNAANIALPFGGLLFVVGAVWAATVEFFAARHLLGTRPPTQWGDAS